MDQILVQLVAGFGAAFTLWNLEFIVLGVAIGIVFGVLPGVGSITALSILIPITFYEAANCVVTGANLLSTIALGIPGNVNRRGPMPCRQPVDVAGDEDAPIRVEEPDEAPPNHRRRRAGFLTACRPLVSACGIRGRHALVIGSGRGGAAGPAAGATRAIHGGTR